MITKSEKIFSPPVTAHNILTSPQVPTVENLSQLNETGVQMVKAPINRIMAQIVTNTAQAWLIRMKLLMEKILVYKARMDNFVTPRLSAQKITITVTSFMSMVTESSPPIARTSVMWYPIPPTTAQATASPWYATATT